MMRFGFIQFMRTCREFWGTVVTLTRGTFQRLRRLDVHRDGRRCHGANG